MSPMRIQNADLTYLTISIQILENKNLFQILGQTGSYIERV